MNCITERLTELTTCSICREIYTTPKILQCYHTFCEDCIQGVLDQSPDSRAPCPICRRTFSPPEGKAQNLQGCTFMQDVLEMIHDSKRRSERDICGVCEEHEAIATYFCTECNRPMCDKCTNMHNKFKTDSHTVESLDKVKDSHGTAAITAKKCRRTCKSHPENHVEFICVICNVPICNVCNSTEHSSHITQSIQRSAEETRDLFKTSTLGLNKDLKTLEETIKSLRYISTSLQTNRNTALEETRRTVEGFIRILKEKEERVKSEIERKFTFHNKTIQDMLENAEMQLAIRQSLVQHISVLDTLGNDVQLAQEKAAIENRYDQLQQNHLANRPDGRDFKIHFQSSDEILEMLRRSDIGHVLDEEQSRKLERPTLSPLSMDRSHFSAQSGLPPGLASFQPLSRNSRSNSYEDQSYIQPVSDEVDDNTNPKQLRKRNSEETDPKRFLTSDDDYTLPNPLRDETPRKEVYVPSSIPTSPRPEPPKPRLQGNTLRVVNKRSSETTPSCIRSQVKISGMCITDRDEMIVVSTDSAKCLVYSAQGALRNEITDRMVRPWDATSSKIHSGQGEIIFITDTGLKSGEGCVKEYTIDGVFVRNVVKKLKRPYGITVSISGDIFVCDAEDQSVLMISYGNAGKAKTKKIKLGGPDLFVCPWYVTLTPTGKLIISDHEAGDIKIHDVKENKTTVYKPEASTAENKFRPAMNCMDRNSRKVYVVDQSCNLFYVLTKEKKFMKILPPSRLAVSKPIALAMNSKGQLWIASRNGDLVVIPNDIM